MVRNFTKEALLSRWEDRRTLQNLMGKLSQSYLMMEEGLIFERWWSDRSDICLGVNDGWYSGIDAVKGYYEALGKKIALGSRLIAKAFPDKLADKTEAQLYGVGQLGIKPIDTFIIEQSGDGKTAKGLWSVHGTYSEITPAGPVSYWEWGYFCVDFIREGETWKIWHMRHLLDINNPTGGDWAAQPTAFPEDARFEQMKSFSFPKPNVPALLREAYYPGRAFTESPPLPEPYDTFSETFSYGM